MYTLSQLTFSAVAPETRIITAFVLAFIINAYSIPIIIRVSFAKKLFDKPGDNRKIHTSNTPNLGGLGMYASILISGLLTIYCFDSVSASAFPHAIPIHAVLAGLTILLFIGMMDDMINVKPMKKLLAETIAIGILIFIGNLSLTSMQGMFSIGAIPMPGSILLTFFAGITIINAFNLIDGIGGLASAVSMLASLAFGILFYNAGDSEFALLAAIVAGTNVPFFIYNVFGKQNKIFMGDSGALIMGFIMFVFVLRFNALNVNLELNPLFKAAPAFSFAVLILPMFDTMRVLLIRIMKGKSPFEADRRHLHHILIDLGLSHLQATLVLIAVNAGFIVIAFSLDFIGNSALLLIILALSFTLTSVAYLLLRNKTANLSRISNSVNVKQNVAMQQG